MLLLSSRPVCCLEFSSRAERGWIGWSGDSQLEGSAVCGRPRYDNYHRVVCRPPRGRAESSSSEDEVLPGASLPYVGARTSYMVPPPYLMARSSENNQCSAAGRVGGGQCLCHHIEGAHTPKIADSGSCVCGFLLRLQKLS